MLFDRRGTGASEAVPMPTWEEWANDVRAVLDAAGSEQLVALAMSGEDPLHGGLLPGSGKDRPRSQRGEAAAAM